MNEKTVLITENNGHYKIENNGISDFELIGMLECILFDLKSISRVKSETKTESSDI